MKFYKKARVLIVTFFYVFMMKLVIAQPGLVEYQCPEPAEFNKGLGIYRITQGGLVTFWDLQSFLGQSDQLFDLEGLDAVAVYGPYEHYSSIVCTYKSFNGLIYQASGAFASRKDTSMVYKTVKLIGVKWSDPVNMNGAICRNEYNQETSSRSFIYPDECIFSVESTASQT